MLLTAVRLVAGETLATWLETARPWREIVSAFVQAGDGLAAAHTAGLIHRDFKPANVLVDRGGRVRVGDFGLAREDDPELAKGSERLVAGTPGYMAPEQRVGDPVDARADQYAFAVSLQQALRKAANHALLVRTRYSEEDVRRVARVLLRREQSVKYTLEDAVAEVSLWSDFEVSQFCEENEVCLSFFLGYRMLNVVSFFLVAQGARVAHRGAL